MKAWAGDATKERTTFGGLRRGQLMARVRSVGNKTTEERLASLLRRNNISGWRRHLPLPGKPDFAWPRLRLAVFVDGCFWHGHPCGRNIAPRINAKAWQDKICGNKSRDYRTNKILRTAGWTVVRIWECLLAKNPVQSLQRIQEALDKTSSRSRPRKEPRRRGRGPNRKRGGLSAHL